MTFVGLGTFAVVGLFLHYKTLKIIIYNGVGIKMTIIQAKLYLLFSLIFKAIKTFSSG